MFRLAPALLLILFTLPALAGEPEGLAKVDMARCFKEFPDRPQIEARLKAMQEELKAKLEEQARSLKEMGERFKKLEDPEARQRAQREFNAARQALQSREREARNQIQNAYQKIHQDVLQLIARIAAQISQKQGFAMLYDSAMVDKMIKEKRPSKAPIVYVRGKPGTDITDDVIAELKVYLAKRRARIEAKRLEAEEARKEKKAKKKPGKKKLF